jgi:hypothetical protein
MSDNTVDEDDPDYEDEEPTTPDRIPELIEPGRMKFTFWSIDENGGEVGTDVILTWDGEQEVEWYEDISPETEGLSVMSSAPFRGTASWPNGRDVAVTYSSSEFRMAGEDVLKKAAPISMSGDTRDVDEWTQFAQEIVELVEGLTN